MGTSAGPSLQGIGRGGDSNLVLEMDAHDAKSYPGEPTSNVFKHAANGYPNGWWGDGSNQSFANIAASNVYDPSLQHNGYPTVLWTPGTSLNCYLNGTADIPNDVLSTEWTFSCYIKAQDGGTLGTSDNNLGVYIYYPSTGSATGTTVDVGNGWYRVFRSVSGSSNYVGLAGFSGLRAGVRFYLSGPQLEKKTYPTPFVTGVLNSGEVYDARPVSTNLMIHGGGTANIGDSSPSKHVVSTAGGIHKSSAQSKFTGGSISFDGNGDYLSIAPSSDFNFGEEDFTLDVWIMRNALTNDDTIWGNGVAEADATCMLYFNSSGHLRLYQAGGTLLTTTSTGISTGTWYHVALVRNGTNLSIYVDGASKASGTLSNYDTGQASQAGTTVSGSGTTWTSAMVGRTFDFASSPSAGIVTSFTSATELEVTVNQTVGSLENYNIAYKFGSSSQSNTIGTRNGSGTAYDWDGYMDEYRITKGTALWLSDFTPPTRRNRSAPVVDRSGNDNGGNFNTKEMTDVTTYRVGEVIEPIASAVWDYDGTDDKISIATDSVDVYCFTIAVQQYKEYTPDLTPGNSNVGFVMGGNTFNGIIMGSWTGTMTDETLSWWGYSSTPTTGSSATYIRDTILAGWHIFTFNWNGSDYDIWVDGTKRTTYPRGGGSGHSGLFKGVTAITPGWSGSGWNGYFEGKMGFLRAYDKSLTDQQIIENFHSKRNSLNIPNWSNRDIVKDGLQLWLDAQESASYSGTGSTWYDLTSNNYDVALTASPLWSNTGYFDFNGTTQWGSHTFASAIGTQTALTTEVWVNWDGKVGWNTIFDMPNDDYLVGLHNGIFYFYDPTHNSGFTLTSGTWYQLVVAYDSTGTSYFYVNGASVSSFTNTITHAPGYFSVGAGWGPNELFDGQIAIINWYNRQLSASEIEQNFIVRRQRFGI